MIDRLLVAACLLACTSQALAAPCEATKEVVTGTLCVIKPSKTDAQIQDADPTNKGFGDHVVGIPSQGTNGLWVHLPGSGAKPYLPKPRRYLDEPWLIELMGQGYTVLDLAYANTESITDSCNSEAGKQVNNCAGAARQEVLTGVNASPLREVDVANSVRHRVAALVDYLHDNGIALPEGSYPFEEWADVSVSGHSQGAGNAYYLAKYSGVKFACMLGGPYDVADDVPTTRTGRDNIADWYLDTATNATPVKQMGAFLTTADSAYTAFTATYALIGLTKGVEWFEADKRRYTDDAGKLVDAHAAAVLDPSLASLRAEACFR